MKSFKYVNLIFMLLALFLLQEAPSVSASSVVAVSFNISQGVYTEGQPIESSIIIVNGGAPAGGSPQTEGGWPIKYQAARSFKVVPGKRYRVTGQVSYKKWGIIPMKRWINTVVYVPYGQYLYG